MEIVCGRLSRIPKAPEGAVGGFFPGVCPGKQVAGASVYLSPSPAGLRSRWKQGDLLMVLHEDCDRAGEPRFDVQYPSLTPKLGSVAPAPGGNLVKKKYSSL